MVCGLDHSDSQPFNYESELAVDIVNLQSPILGLIYLQTTLYKATQDIMQKIIVHNTNLKL